MDGHISQYKEIIGNLKEEIDSLKDQLKLEQAKKELQAQSHNPKWITPIHQQVEIEKVDRIKNLQAQLTVNP